MKKRIVTVILLFTWNIAIADTLNDPYNEYISDLNLPGISTYNYEWSNELLITAKEILARALEYLPMLVLILLLLACIKIIFDWDWKAGLKRIKYIIIWIALMIVSIYVVNILSTIFFWHPVLNIHLNGWY